MVDDVLHHSRDVMVEGDDHTGADVVLTGRTTGEVAVGGGTHQGRGDGLQLTEDVDLHRRGPSERIAAKERGRHDVKEASSTR